MLLHSFSVEVSHSLLLNQDIIGIVIIKRLLIYTNYQQPGQYYFHLNFHKELGQDNPRKINITIIMSTEQ